MHAAATAEKLRQCSSNARSSLHAKTMTRSYLANSFTVSLCACLFLFLLLNPLDPEGNYSVTSNNTKLVHWPLMDGLLHLVQRGGVWAGCGPVQYPHRCTNCNSPSINGQCTNHCIAILWEMVRCSAVLMWRLKG